MMMRNLAFLLATAALLFAMQQTKPGYARITGPINYHAGWKERGATQAFAAELIGGKVARRLKAGPKILTSSGVWVLVGVRAESLKESAMIASARWRDARGIEYRASDRVPSSLPVLTSARLEPGLPQTGVLVFEIPEQALRNGEITLALNPYWPLGGELALAAGPLGEAAILEEFDLQL